MAGKKEVLLAVKVDEEEEQMLKMCAKLHNNTVSDLMRNAIANGLPSAVFNPFTSRTNLYDVINGMRDAVKFLLNKRKTKD